MEIRVDFNKEELLFVDSKQTDYFLRGRNYSIPFDEYIESKIIEINDVKFLIVISENNELCLCSRKAKYKELLRRFVENTDESRNLLKQYAKKFDYTHKILATIATAAMNEYNLNPYSFGDDKLGLSATSDYLRGSYIVFFVDSLREAKSKCDSILPENIESTKKKQIEEKTNEIIHSFQTLLGNDFELLSKTDEEVLAALLSKNQNLSEMIISIEDDKENIQTAIDNNVINLIWRERFMDLFPRILSIAYEALFSQEREYLLRRYGDLSEAKANFQKSIEKLSFMDSLELYKEYQNTLGVIAAEMRQRNLPLFEDNPWEKYRKYYACGSVLISDHMNKIYKNKAKNKPIAQAEIDEAMVFFYDASSAEEAYEQRRNVTYKENKVAGNIGEKNVNYALKWLDSSYTQIEHKSTDKIGEKCILIRNDEFINEAQEYDHIIVSYKGIFLIETKNYKGKIRIDSDHNWSRETNGEISGITNPLQQVRQHEKVLRSFLPKELPIISIVCIANDHAIIEGSENSDVPIVKSDRLVEFIETYDTGVENISEQQKQECVEDIYKYMI